MRQFLILGTFALALIFVPVADGQPLTIHGFLAKSGGAGLSDATVELLPLAPVHRLAELQLSGHRGPEVAKRTRTDRDGAFQLQVPAGFWQVVVRHEDYLPAVYDLSPLLTDRHLPRFEMQPRSEQAARLSGETGQPAGTSFWWLPVGRSRGKRPRGSVGDRSSGGCARTNKVWLPCPAAVPSR